ncbi:MAG: N-acetyl-gamma-glutamyl-phosphate reductase [Flavobacteriaceae bacterium]|jgi:N-acetyl-gamma-glutamyl-phosphate reductase|nr:N-acetyl-gamma-glutamyl-phosphate reductase [Flavobacteriaceae bacterium]
MNKIKASIAGGASYTAGELLRILINHSHVEIASVFSTTNAGNPVTKIHNDLLGETDLYFTDKIDTHSDIVFLCLGYGKSRPFLEENKFSPKTHIIDLSNDFRLKPDSVFEEKTFVYGLPELQKETIKQAQYIANPGCYATAIQLALLPLAKNRLLNETVHINATTGSTGAGIKPTFSTHFSWRSNNLSHYKAFEHQHLGEIRQSLTWLQGSLTNELLFIPNRGGFARGIFMTAYTLIDSDLDAVVSLYKDFYKNEPFVTVTTEDINLKQVVQTNKCIISLVKKGRYLLITSIIDNLVKGASGQAIQNMNLMFGLDETEGLRFKPGGF